MSVSVANESQRECFMLEQEIRARERALMSASCDRVSTALGEEIVDQCLASMSRDIAVCVYE
jgi:hypothetical protein